MSELTRRIDAWLGSEGTVWTQWAVVGTEGAVTFTVRSGGRRDTLAWGVDGHYATPPSHADYCGEHAECALTGGKCWLDGSPLMASELWDAAQATGNDERYPDMDVIWRRLEGVYADWMTHSHRTEESTR